MDMQWLSTEARQIHDIFSAAFYSVVLLLLTIGVVTNYFKMPMGQVPEFMQLVGRAVIAAFILASLPEIMNIFANITDELAQTIGNLHNFKLVVARLGEKVGSLTWSWVSVKDSVLLIISYFSYFILYVSVYVADSVYLFTWTLLYVFSPLLIAGFVLPTTASATAGLFRSLVEVCLWKICWSVMAALLWSFALSQINDPKYDVDFLTAIILNLMLAFSVVITPMLVRSLIKGGLSSTASTMGTALLATAALTPTGMLQAVKGGAGAAMSSARRNKESGDDEDQTRFSRPVRPQR